MSTKQSIALRRLESLRDDVRAATRDWLDSGRLKEWDLAARAALRQIFADADAYSRELDNVWWEPQVSWDDMPETDYDEAFVRGRGQAVAILSAAITEAKDYRVSSISPDRDRLSRELLAVEATPINKRSEVAQGVAEKRTTFRDRLEHHWLVTASAIVIATATITVGVTWYVYVTPLTNENARLKEQLGTNQIERLVLPKIVLQPTWVEPESSVVLEDGQATILVEGILSGAESASIRVNPAVGDPISTKLDLGEKHVFRSGEAEYVINALAFNGAISVQVSVTRTK